MNMAFVNSQRELLLCSKIVTVLLAGHTIWRQSPISYDGFLGYHAYLMAGEEYDKAKHHDELVRLCKALEDSDQGVVCRSDGAMMSDSKAKEIFKADPKLHMLAISMKSMFGEPVEIN